MKAKEVAQWAKVRSSKEEKVVKQLLIETEAVASEEEEKVWYCNGFNVYDPLLIQHVIYPDCL